MPRFRTIVATIDFSDSAADALDAAVALATDVGSQLHLLHVVPSAVPPVWTDEPPPLDLRTVEQARVEGALTQLETLAASRSLDPPRFTTAAVVGAPGSEILRYAEEHRADVIVLGSHGHGLVRRFLLGSVADTLVRQAPCAVLVVPHHTLRPAPPAPSAADVPALSQE
jgi:nucleotide-binding universal stress UspA family protein